MAGQCLDERYRALATLIVLAVVIATKFLLGAWLVVFSIPLLVSLFIAIHRHYRYVAQRLSLDGVAPRSYLPRPQAETITHPAIVIVGQLNKGTLEALDYARSIADHIVGVHVNIGSTDREKLQRRWQELENDIELVILDSPYCSVVGPIVEYINRFEAQYPDILSTIIIPTFVTRKWWENILHNQTTLFLKASLRASKKRVVSSLR